MRTDMGKYLRKNQTKMNIPIRIAAVLLCLVLFSTYLVGGLFARYTTTAQGGDSARVAKFSIHGSGELMQPIAASLVPGTAEDVTLVIKNDSEVAVKYTVTVTRETDNLPLTLQLKAEGGEDGPTHTVQQLPGSHTDTYTLHIDWPAAAESAEDLALMGMVDYITVTVTAVQID